MIGRKGLGALELVMTALIMIILVFVLLPLILNSAKAFVVDCGPTGIYSEKNYPSASVLSREEEGYCYAEATLTEVQLAEIEAERIYREQRERDNKDKESLPIPCYEDIRSTADNTIIICDGETLVTGSATYMVGVEQKFQAYYNGEKGSCQIVVYDPNGIDTLRENVSDCSENTPITLDYTPMEVSTNYDLDVITPMSSAKVQLVFVSDPDAPVVLNPDIPGIPGTQSDPATLIKLKLTTSDYPENQLYVANLNPIFRLSHPIAIATGFQCFIEIATIGFDPSAPKGISKVIHAEKVGACDKNAVTLVTVLEAGKPYTLTTGLTTGVNVRKNVQRYEIILP